MIEEGRGKKLELFSVLEMNSVQFLCVLNMIDMSYQGLSL